VTARRYPLGLDAEKLVELAATCWRAHDGQWFLKAMAEVGLETAMRLNERALASLGRIELRELRRVSGLDALDTMEQVADWYRLVPHLFGGWGHPERTVTVVDADTLLIEQHCFGEAVAKSSGYGHLSVGAYPPCLGWMARQRAWGEAWSPRYRFTIEREPVEGRPCRYLVRRHRRAANPGEAPPA